MRVCNKGSLGGPSDKDEGAERPRPDRREDGAALSRHHGRDDGDVADDVEDPDSVTTISAPVSLLCNCHQLNSIIL